MNLRFRRIERTGCVVWTKVGDFHIVHSIHCKWFTYPYSTNKYTILLLCISLHFT